MWTNPRYSELTGRPSPDAAAKPPEPTGQVVATFPRKALSGPTTELRVSLESYLGSDYISVRCWELDQAGQWWPTKKCVSVRLSEAAGVA